MDRCGAGSQNWPRHCSARSGAPRKRGRPVDEESRARKREEILATAAKVFAARGYQGTDVQAVADAAGVAKGTLYLYFASKEDLFLAAVDQGMNCLTAFVDAAVDGISDPLEIIGTAILLLFAGHETTTNLLANGLFHLLRNPAQYALLQEHPALVPGAVEEVLRYDPPVAGTIRIVTEDVELRGRKIPAGASMAAMLASANRDPDHFDQPEQLDVRRSPNRHLAFGHGIHFCLGAGLARMEAQIAFAALLRRGRLRLLDETPAWKPQIFFRGLQRLHVQRACDVEDGARAVEVG